MFSLSFSITSICESIEAGFSQVFSDAEYVHLPLADGGEGTVEVLLQGQSVTKLTRQHGSISPWSSVENLH